MKVIKINGKDCLIRTVVQEGIASDWIEETIGNLVDNFGRLIQVLADENHLSDASVRRFCGFAGCAKEIEIIDRKELD